MKGEDIAILGGLGLLAYMATRSPAQPAATQQEPNFQPANGGAPVYIPPPLPSPVNTGYTAAPQVSSNTPNYQPASGAPPVYVPPVHNANPITPPPSPATPSPSPNFQPASGPAIYVPPTQTSIHQFAPTMSVQAPKLGGGFVTVSPTTSLTTPQLTQLTSLKPSYGGATGLPSGAYNISGLGTVIVKSGGSNPDGSLKYPIRYS